MGSSVVKPGGMFSPALERILDILKHKENSIL
ncbi:hypothetical protein PSYAR_21777 [Pseudomonas syringae pv. aceris str. M302273]|nr:hypothetical protein PSYAR_21777 [Pseudomonas syringae pv. aceris str. M302273]